MVKEHEFVVVLATWKLDSLDTGESEFTQQGVIESWDLTQGFVNAVLT